MRQFLASSFLSELYEQFFYVLAFIMASKGNAEVNYVHQNAILCETIKKEQRNHKLYTNYSINPFKKSKKEISVKHDIFLFS